MLKLSPRRLHVGVPCDRGRYAALSLPIPCCRGDKPSRPALVHCYRGDLTRLSGQFDERRYAAWRRSMACGAVGTTRRSFPFRFDAIPFPPVLIRAISSAIACRPGALSFSLYRFPRPPGGPLLSDGAVDVLRCVAAIRPTPRRTGAPVRAPRPRHRPARCARWGSGWHAFPRGWPPRRRLIRQCALPAHGWQSRTP